MQSWQRCTGPRSTPSCRSRSLASCHHRADFPDRRHADRSPGLLSYAHIDNCPVVTESDGWVTLLHKTLKNYLDRLLGREADIWRDDRLERNQLFWDEIAEKLAHTAVLVAVLSPRYIAPASCADEFRQFCEIAERDGGLAVGNRSRIFKCCRCR